MANERQLKLKTKYVATRGVKEYRASIRDWVTKDDVVLEVGCEWGTTSVLIEPECKELVATDISQDCVDRAKERHPGIRFEVLDAFDVRAALELNRPFTKVYIDISGISGYRATLDGLALLNMYATAFRLEAIVVKSGALKQLAARLIPWTM
ncbi:MAG: class I SAM-dependent methyltransferase [Candidatus Latescibacteria bacterium]|jgi:hypothetical protein|nr:class I SAM-dependent methyltransferase [Candidatus Latescibacterota bacterium]